MRCANCWEEILQPSPNSTELAIQWILRTSSIACFRPNFFFFEGSAVCPACYSILGGTGASRKTDPIDCLKIL
jgi:hypothetical protein